MEIAYGCCVGSWDKFHQYVVPSVPKGRPIIALSGRDSITAAYNDIMDTAAGRGAEVLVLVHDDLEITDPQVEEKLLIAFNMRYEGIGSVGLVGVAGGSARNGLAWWSADPVGHQMIDTGMIDFGQRHGVVDSVEGSFMAFSAWAMDNVRFNESFEGFHGYDHIGKSIYHSGRIAVVADIDTHHHTTAGFKSPESEQAWIDADRKFRGEYLR